MSLLINNLLNKFLKPQIGAFGEIVFECSSFKVLTFDNYRRDTKARYSKHELINRTSLIEYLGRDAEEISFKMTFTTALKVNPQAEAAKIRKLCVEGTADYLILGNEVVGDNQWIIESVNESATAWDNCGHVIVSELNVKMVECVAKVEKNDV